MKDFPYFRNEIASAMRPAGLEAIGKEISDSKTQTEAFGDSAKLTDSQLNDLRKLYGERMKKLKSDIGNRPLG